MVSGNCLCGQCAVKIPAPEPNAFLVGGNCHCGFEFDLHTNTPSLYDGGLPVTAIVANTSLVHRTLSTSNVPVKTCTYWEDH